MSKADELKKEIADWWRTKFCVELEDDICQKLTIDEVEELCNKIAEPREKRIAELEQENTELKEKYFKNITDCDWCDTYCNSQFNKAKELLKEWAYNYGHVNELLEQKSLSFINKE